MMQAALPADTWEAVHAVLRAHDDAFLAVASGRYEWIGRMIRAAVTRPRVGQIGLTERLDRWAAHPLWGLLILAGILGLVVLADVQHWQPAAGLAGGADRRAVGRIGRRVRWRMRRSGCAACWWTA